MANVLKVIDLFSGCGGSALGFSLAGFSIKVAVDNDPKASESFKINFSGIGGKTTDNNFGFLTFGQFLNRIVIKPAIFTQFIRYSLKVFAGNGDGCAVG